MSELDRPKCCRDWEENLLKLGRLLYISYGLSPDGISKFIFCPWCGKRQTLTERATEPRRDKQLGRRKYDLDPKARAPKTENYNRRLREEGRKSAGSGI